MDSKKKNQATAYQMIKTARHIFSPEELILNNAIDIIDNLAIIKLEFKTDRDKALFNIALRYVYYGSGAGIPIFYDGNYTVYFSVVDGNLYGGVYNLQTNHCITNCLIINVINPMDTDCKYIYAQKSIAFEKIKSKLCR